MSELKLDSFKRIFLKENFLLIRIKRKYLYIICNLIYLNKIKDKIEEIERRTIF